LILDTIISSHEEQQTRGHFIQWKKIGLNHSPRKERLRGYYFIYFNSFFSYPIR